MSKELIYRKGYLLKTTSWENDADYYKTTENSVDTLEEAKALKKMFLILFKSKNNGENGIGNSFDDESERIEEYRLTCDYFKEKFTEEEFGIFVSDIAHEYTGSSECYQYRICESCELYEVKEDVYLDKVKVE